MRKTTLHAGTGQFVIMDPINGRSVVLRSTRIKPIVINSDTDDDVIESIQYNGLPTIGRGKQIVLGKEPFRVNHIEASGENFILHASKLTKASYFMLPALGENRSYFLWDSLFVNAFVDVEDACYESLGPHLYLLYRFSKKRSYARFEQIIQQNELFVNMFDVDPFHVLYTFRIPDELVIEYRLFKKGAYSKLHVNYKQQVLAFHQAGRSSSLAGILNKTESFRQRLSKDLAAEIHKSAELHDAPVLHEETFLNKYKIKKVLEPNVEFE
jgi:hypothetical protein